MKHFVIVNDWANEYESGTTILGVTHSIEEAKDIFIESLDDVIRFAEEDGFIIYYVFYYDDCETVFDAGEDGYYANNHTNLYIQMVP